MRLAGIGLLAAAVAVALHLTGRVHTVNPALSLFGRQYVAAVALKAVLATVALAWPRCRCCWPSGFTGSRRWRAARRVRRRWRTGLWVSGCSLLPLPIAVHCLIAYDVQLTSVRVAVHSLAGCFFYGAFVAKVLLVQTRRLPGRVLPAVGGTLAVVVAVLWYTSALWYYNGYQLPHI
jgi:Family of unknown function (DUF6529)